MFLTLVTSFKPFGLDPDYDRFQLLARTSWSSQFDKIVFFNDYEPLMDGHQVHWIKPKEKFPRMKDILTCCGEQTTPTVFCTADDYLAGHFKETILELIGKGFLCGTTLRWNYDKNTLHFDKSEVCGGGLDLFYAVPSIWKQLAKEIPNEFHIACPTYDAWMSQWFEIFHGDHYCNFWKRRTMLHPLGTSPTTNPKPESKEGGDWWRDHPNHIIVTGRGKVTIIE